MFKAFICFYLKNTKKIWVTVLWTLNDGVSQYLIISAFHGEVAKQSKSQMQYKNAWILN